jgi:hypothetical protein
MNIKVVCDGKNCSTELEIDLDDGNWDEIPDMKIERELERNGWYSNLDGDYCTKCAEKARKDWRNGGEG